MQRLKRVEKKMVWHMYGFSSKDRKPNEQLMQPLEIDSVYNSTMCEILLCMFVLHKKY